MPASALFCQHVLQHRLVEAQIGNQPLQPQIFLFQLPYMLQLRRRNAAVFFTPCIESGIRNAQLATDAGTDVPSSACFRAKTICSSVNRGFFIGTSSVQGSHYHAGIQFMNGAEFWVRATFLRIIQQPARVTQSGAADIFPRAFPQFSIKQPG